MDKDTDERKFDVRALERKFDDGEITRDEYQSYLDDLEDVSDQAEPIEAEFEEGVFEDDEPEGEALEDDEPTDASDESDDETE